MNRRNILRGTLGAVAAASVGATARNASPALVAGRLRSRYGYAADEGIEGSGLLTGLADRAASSLLREQAEAARRRAELRMVRRQRLRSMSDAARDAYALDDEAEADRLWLLFRKQFDREELA